MPNLRSAAAAAPSRARPEPVDPQLVQRLRQGEHAALREVMGEHWPAVVSYSASLLGPAHPAADDIAQEAFLRLWEHRVEWAPTSALRPLLFRIARNLALNEKRRQRVRVRGKERVARAEGGRLPSPVEETEEGELRARVEAAIASLPRRRREVFVLARFQSLTFCEIAAVLEISPQTVANQMSAALAHLRRELRPFLEEAEESAASDGSARGGGVF